MISTFAEAMAVGMSRSERIRERFQHGSTELDNHGQRGGAREAGLMFSSGLGSGVDGGTRLRVKDCKRRLKFGGEGGCFLLGHTQVPLGNQVEMSNK